MRHELRSFSITVLLATLAATSACAHPPVGETPQTQQLVHTSSNNHQQTRVPGEYLVTLAAGETERVISERYARFGIKSIQALSKSTFLLSITDDIGPEGMRAIIEQDIRFIAIQPNFIYRAN